MADAQIYKAGSPVISYGQGLGHPTHYTPPYGIPPRRGMSIPPFNAHFSGSAGSEDYPAGCALRPGFLDWQRYNLLANEPEVGDIIQMIVVPTNYYIHCVRFDVNSIDTRLAGMTGIVTGQRVSVDPSNPSRYTVTEIPDITDAATAQGITSIDLDTPSSTMVWLDKVTNVSGTISGNAPNGGGAITGGVIDAGASGYVIPLYVEPEFVPDANGDLVRYETGALILGLKLLTPASPAFPIWDTTSDFYLTTRVTSHACPAFS
jgi:hypothetical protein